MFYLFYITYGTLIFGLNLLGSYYYIVFHGLLRTRLPRKILLSYGFLMYNVYFNINRSSCIDLILSYVYFSFFCISSAASESFLIITRANPLLAGKILCLPLCAIKNETMNCDTTSRVFERFPKNIKNSKSSVRLLIMLIYYC